MTSVQAAKHSNEPKRAELFYQIGPFRLDLAQERCFRDGEEASVEPKVLELMGYLCRCGDRYVPVAELHEQVWAGRVVSDAAVRRTISKLRAFLEDDAAQPQYLHSQPRRGYKLHSQPCPRPFIPRSQPSVAAFEVGGSVGPLMRFRTLRSAQALAVVLGLVVFVALLLALGFGFVPAESGVASNPAQQAQLVVEKMGAAGTPAISPDGQWLAYTSETDAVRGKQLFVMELATGRSRQLTLDAGTVLSTVFSRDGQTLYYAAHRQNGAQLMALPLSSGATPVMLADDFHLIGQMERDNSGEGLVFAQMRTSEQTPRLVRFDLASQQFSEFYSHIEPFLPTQLARFSPDGRQLAIVSVVEERSSQISIIDLHEQRLVRRLAHPYRVHQLRWLSEQALVMLDKAQTWQITLGERREQWEPVAASDAWSDLVVLSDGRVMGVRNEIPAQIFFERSVPRTSEPRLVLQVQGIVDGAFVRPGHWLYTVQTESGYELRSRLADTEHTHLRFSESVELVDVAGLSELALLRVGQRLALVDLAQNQLTYLTAQGQALANAPGFIWGERQVAFAVFEQGQWHLSLWDIAQQRVVAYLPGLQGARSLGSRLVVMDEAGQLAYLAPNDDPAMLPLPQLQHLYTSLRWFSRADCLFWNVHELDSYRIVTMCPGDDQGQRELASGSQKRFASRFDVSDNGHELLLRHAAMAKSQFVEIQL
ncbi:winged helix-turn-helix domain-containing protein [Ferrimonas pelagia]|uniref:OmpR/PhoB-type domain-containing protein n=1 Tax=Ferrimonas pelagia TaxID=1177826 RepID=A0ABP9FEH8_9GAMM